MSSIEWTWQSNLSKSTRNHMVNVVFQFSHFVHTRKTKCMIYFLTNFNYQQHPTYSKSCSITIKKKSYILIIPQIMHDRGWQYFSSKLTCGEGKVKEGKPSGKDVAIPLYLHPTVSSRAAREMSNFNNVAIFLPHLSPSFIHRSDPPVSSRSYQGCFYIYIY